MLTFVPLYAIGQQTHVDGSLTWDTIEGYNANPSQQQIAMDQAVQLFNNYLASLRNPDLALHEVEEYQNNFYATFYEKSTGIFAFQMLIWKPGAPMMGGGMGGGMMSDIVVPESGPNMMWNTKYGMMGGMMGVYHQGSSANMTVSPEQAKAIAQQYLDSNYPATKAGDVDIFYGYYNVDVLLNAATFGMLSVNGYTGQVWYHTWHGTYIQTVTISEVTAPVPEFGQLTPMLMAAFFILATALILAQRGRIKDSKRNSLVSPLSVQVGERLLSKPNHHPTTIILDN